MEKFKTWLDNSWWNWGNAINYRFVHYNDNIDRCAFFEELNYGWYQMYIYPYDDLYMPIISEQRKLLLAEEPYTFYVSEVDYDWIMEKLENPNPPSDALRKLFERKIPWDTP